MKIAPCTALGLCFAAVNFGLAAAESKPDFAKLVPVAPCPELVQAARDRKIPIQGIAPSGKPGSLTPGDSATALITLFEKGGHRTQWLLLVEAAAPTEQEKAREPASPSVFYVGAGDKVEINREFAPIALRLIGPFLEGKKKPAKVEDTSARVTVDKGYLAIGHAEAAAAIYRIVQSHLHGHLEVHRAPFTDQQAAEGRKGVDALKLTTEEQRSFVGAPMALESYFRLVQQTPGLDEVFPKVVKPPSVWSLVRHFGVTVSLDLLDKQVAPSDSAIWNLAAATPCYRLPFEFLVNQQPAVIVTLVVAPPLPPLLSCGGIVGLVAERPDDKETYLSLEIISARYGADAGSSSKNQ